jgi:hypothetical protein
MDPDPGGPKTRGSSGSGGSEFGSESATLVRATILLYLPLNSISSPSAGMLCQKLMLSAGASWESPAGGAAAATVSGK